MKIASLFAATYTHPESHGPHLSSVLALSSKVGKLTVLARNVVPTDWMYPNNVRIVLSGEYVYISETQKKSTPWKILSFLRFAVRMWKILHRDRFSVVLLYDPIPLLAFGLVRRFIGYKPKVWYHNYDIIEKENVRRYSISWVAVKYEPLAFSIINIFSLPSEDRLPYFPLANFEGKIFLLPNYPRRSLYRNSARRQRNAPTDEVRLIFCGTISPGHGLEEIISQLRSPILDKKLILILKGHSAEEYRAELMHLAKLSDATDRLRIIGRGPLSEVPEIIESCDIGIAIYTGDDLMNRTLGLGASCKIFEYIAAGLPVLLEQTHYERCFKNYEWARPTMVNGTSIAAQISTILANYERMSRAAVHDFDLSFNCDRYFDQIMELLSSQEH